MSEKEFLKTDLFKDIRKLINIIDEVRDYGLDKEISLPRIAVGDSVKWQELTPLKHSWLGFPTKRLRGCYEETFGVEVGPYRFT
jgi:hypothetical protein